MPSNNKRGAGRRGGNRQPMQVTVIDKDGGSDAVKIDRIIADLASSQGDVQVLCSGVASFDSTTADTFSYITYDNIRSSDDFVSFAAQFQKFRVSAIRFDIYDLSPALVAPAFWGTFHSSVTAPLPALTVQDVIDMEDSKAIPPGEGKISLYWRAKGVDELIFDATASANAPPPTGGLAVFQNASSAGVKFRVVYKAIVHFRGRR